MGHSSSLVLVFGTFGFARVLVVELIGFGLAVALLLDATLIRMVLIAALMHLVGECNWWPSKPAEGISFLLDRRVPLPFRETCPASPSARPQP